MSEDVPLPFVPAEVDLRGLSGFMLDVDRLLASELVALATPEECWAALMLWCRAWQQSPPASLPDDDRILAAFSGAGKRWRKVKSMALRGFIKCSDGRLYHLVLATEAMKAWKKRESYRADQERLKRWRKAQRNDAGDGKETPDETHFNGISEPEEKGQGQGQKESTQPNTESCGAAPRSAAQDYAFDGDVIRLTRADFEKFQREFKQLNGSLRTEITKADAYYRDNPPKNGKWWFPLNKWLAKANKEASGEATRGEDSW